MNCHDVVDGDGHLAAGLAPRDGLHVASRAGGVNPAAKWAVAVWAAFAATGTAGVCGAEPARAIDVRRLEAAGFRVLDGKHVRIVTDLPPSPAVDELPAVFDAAVPQWATYFDVPATRLNGARWLGFLIKDREALAALGLMPAERPDFPTGYAKDWEFWLLEQPSDYYRRHLMLHEGTHAFMQTQLGSCGAPWYMEGIAELMATHKWRDGTLKLNVFPGRREDFPMWGRIKLIRDAVAKGEAWSIERVLAIDNSRIMSTEEYAWTWALCALVDGHPKFRDSFRKIHKHVLDVDPPFDDRFKMEFMYDWGSLHWEWQSFVAELDFGIDISRIAFVHRQPKRGGSRIEIRVDRGWQSTGWRLFQDETVRVRSSGRFQIVGGEEPWMCEAGGVTIEYHNGKPLGVLLGAITDGLGDKEASFVQPLAIGLETSVTVPRDGVLYVRINESPANLADNEGVLTLELERIVPAPRFRADGAAP